MTADEIDALLERVMDGATIELAASELNIELASVLSQDDLAERLRYAKTICKGKVIESLFAAATSGNVMAAKLWIELTQTSSSQVNVGTDDGNTKGTALRVREITQSLRPVTLSGDDDDIR